MDTFTKKKLLRYLIPALLGVLGVVLVLANRFPEMTSAAAVFSALSDAFFASTVFLFSLWLLAIAWYHGAFDLFLYQAELLFSFANRERKDREKRDYYTYQQTKKEQRNSPIYWLFTALAFFVLALLALGIRYLAISA